jgi:GNAT superfamily N-acetyltransferase
MGVHRRIGPLTREQLHRLSAGGAGDLRPPYPLLDTAGRNGNGHRPGPGSAPAGLTPWAEQTLTDWGHCGMVAEHEGRVVGYLAMVPAGQVPHTGAFATTSFGADAAVVLTASVAPDRTRQGIGRQLVQAAAADLVGRRIAALEAVGRRSESVADLGGLPEGWLTAVGFRLVRDHPLAPRYRMSLSSTLRWRPDLSAAWHRIRGLVPQSAPPEPARFRTHRSAEPTAPARPHDPTRVRTDVP